MFSSMIRQRIAKSSTLLYQNWAVPLRPATHTPKACLTQRASLQVGPKPGPIMRLTQSLGTRRAPLPHRHPQA